MLPRHSGQPRSPLRNRVDEPFPTRSIDDGDEEDEDAEDDFDEDNDDTANGDNDADGDEPDNEPVD